MTHHVAWPGVYNWHGAWSCHLSVCLSVCNMFNDDIPVIHNHLIRRVSVYTCLVCCFTGVSYADRPLMTCACLSVCLSVCLYWFVIVALQSCCCCCCCFCYCVNETFVIMCTCTCTVYCECIYCIYTESKKGDTILLSISLLNIDRFS